MIKIIAAGKVKDQHLAALIDSYLVKLAHYHKISVIEVKDEKISADDSAVHIKEIEGARLLAKIKKDDYVIALDLKGQSYDSLAFAAELDTLLAKEANISFIIGGSLGLAPQVIKRADLSFKLSDLTFLHQMTRLILLEQIYRAFKINNHETYHK